MFGLMVYVGMGWDGMEWDKLKFHCLKGWDGMGLNGMYSSHSISYSHFAYPPIWTECDGILN